MFKELKVSSTAINSIAYDKDNEILRIEFHSGNKYDYSDVPESEFAAMAAAPSIGKYYNSVIKKKYS